METSGKKGIEHERIDMRKYAWIKDPNKTVNSISVRKIMLYKADEGYYLFMYSGADDIQSAADLCYVTLDELYDDWNPLIDERGWIEMEDPLPYCQHDAFIPLRVKDRNSGKPEWGRLETLIDGEWVEYEAPQRE